MIPGGGWTPDRLEPLDVATLVTARAWPSVSLLLDTTPADRMVAGDARRLRSLAAQARAELGSHPLLKAGPLLGRLDSLVGRAQQEPTARGLGIFVSQAIEHVVRLPEPVSSRCVVEATFATRDLVRTLHRTPPHLLLMLHGFCAHVYRGYADTLRPLELPEGPCELDLRLVGQVDRGGVDDRDFLDRVDRSLGRLRAEHPAPLVVAGDERMVARFLARSRHLHRLAATVTGAAAEEPATLARAVRAELEVYLLSREEEAVDRLRRARAAAPESVAVGLDAAWQAARDHRPVTLVVDEAHSWSAPPPDERRWTTWHTGPTPAVHDLVDDLIEIVIDRGGWVAFARPGTLGDLAPVALLHTARSGSEEVA